MVEDFKKTEVGIIPSEWNTPLIKEFTDILSGGTPSTKMPEYWGGEIKWMNSGELNLKRVYEVEGRITESGLKNSATKLIPPKCVLVGLAGQGKTRGTVAINYMTLCTNQSIAAILPTQEFDEDYLYHNLDLRYKELRSLSTGDGGRGGLNLTLLRNLAITLPPTKAEQTAIATALNDADALIQKLEQLIAKKRNIKTGAMQELLKPKERWEGKQLGEVVDIDMGQSPDSKNYNSSKEGLPLLQGNADLENRKQIIRFWTSQITKTCDAGDLILTVRAPVGSIGIAIQKSCIGRGVCSLKPKSVSREFIYHLLIFKENDWKILEQGSTFTSANSIQIYGFEIAIPKTEKEQIHIAQILSDMDYEIQELEKQLEKYRMIKQGMMQNLLTGKIRLI